MATPNKNLKAVFEYLGLANLTVSKALNLDPSLISRYLSGHRQLKASNPQMDAIADFILERGRRVQDVEWLKRQFAAAGFQTELSTVQRLKQNLILWLATDGDTLRRNLGTSLPGRVAGSAPHAKKPERARVSVQDNDTKTSCLGIVFALRPALSALPRGTTVGVFCPMTGLLRRRTRTWRRFSSK